MYKHIIIIINKKKKNKKKVPPRFELGSSDSESKVLTAKLDTGQRKKVYATVMFTTGPNAMSPALN